MTTVQAPSSQGETSIQHFSVRLPRVTDAVLKKYSVMKFTGNTNVDFSSVTTAKLERENNYREFKLANDVETMPKFGAGSEFGREQKDLARRKKFGMRIRKYNIKDQPLLLRLGSSKQSRRFKGVQDGGVSENASYYIFTQCGDGAFEASSIGDWYHFTPIAKYKYLNSEEAEEEFDRRDKTLNYFSIMLKKRIKKDEEGAADGEEKETSKKKKSTKDKSLTLTEFEEWADNSADEDENSDREQEDDDEKSKAKKKAAGKLKKANKKKKKDSDDEPEEESDEQDEAEEVDYMSGSSIDNEGMYDETNREDSEKYEQKGVEDEDGLRKLVNSEDEDDDEEDKKDDENDEDEEVKVKDDKAKGSDSESSDSDSDSDLDKMESVNFQSAFFLQSEKKQSIADKKLAASQDAKKDSRPSIPANLDPAVKKRKLDSPVPASKKVKTEASTSGMSNRSNGNEGITEDIVRRYLQRKPMTTQDLLRKLKSCNTALSKDQLVNAVANILKKISPIQTKIKEKLYFSIKKD
jgi:transcription initiation factor TFIIF subunit alpha